MTNKSTTHVEDLAQIRNLMERSSKFPPLSGLSGILVGILALTGAALAFWYLRTDPSKEFYFSPHNVKGPLTLNTLTFMLADALVVLVGSIIIGYAFARKKAKELNQKISDPNASQMIINLMIPLCIGGLFILVLGYHGILFLIAPISLIFYGLGLINCSKYTVSEIKHLGFAQVGIGLISSIIIGEALLFWAIGFGLLHIVGGIILYNKYEKK